MDQNNQRCVKYPRNGKPVPVRTHPRRPMIHPYASDATAADSWKNTDLSLARAHYPAIDGAGGKDKEDKPGSCVDRRARDRLHLLSRPSRAATSKGLTPSHSHRWERQIFLHGALSPCVSLSLIVVYLLCIWGIHVSLLCAPFLSLRISLCASLRV